MKKVGNYVVFTLIVFMFVLIIPKADSCTYKEQAALNKEASNIKFNYEVVDKTDEITEDVWLSDVYYIQVTITNLPDNMYIQVKNNQDDEIKTYHSSDAVDGVISFKKDSQKVIRYTFNIYASTSTCSSKLLTKSLNTPRFNPMYNPSGVCGEIPDYKYCQKLLSTNISDKTLHDSIIKYYQSVISKKTEKKEDKLDIKGVIKNILIVVAIIAVVGTGIFVIVKVIRKRRIV